MDLKISEASHITDLRLLEDADVAALQQQLPAWIAQLQTQDGAGGSSGAASGEASSSQVFRLATLGDLAQLHGDEIHAFVRDIPSLIATMRILDRECTRDGISLQETFPSILFDPALGEKVVLPTSSGEVEIDGNAVIAANSAFETIARARAPRP